ncbi:MAG: putative periplasmic protein [uncultured Sulfurovum sp.]|uniref:Putative periplasmic protein n=1 Tax=uncultured Sulfurovum sp. TaxID=269237 RepID=A0A6S6TGN4_9BACT|nr:MAG: putative periplasmic protein [uncultured Sulfurovum sp.]
MKKYQYKIILASILVMHTLYASNGLDYLNSIRIQSGLPAFTENSALNTSAQNHNNYMQLNDILTHDENRSNSGYTGDYAYLRAISAGYLHGHVSENLSHGTDTVELSIDSLMSAIYHRFAFLDFRQDEIGMADNGAFYTYNMGNSVLSGLCESGVYSGGLSVSPCADSSKLIEASEYNNRYDAIRESSSDIVVWPSIKKGNIPPVFYEESPDPLPFNSVSGYPVSAEFNVASFATAPTVTSFTLKDGNGVSKTLINHAVYGSVMNENSDPNSQFSSYQHAIFPKNRLEWGSKYIATLEYDVDGDSRTKNWCFTTESLKSQVDKFYRITDTIDITAVSGRTYALYVVPTYTHDIISSVSYTYNTNTPELSFIDGNTIQVKLTGAVGRYSIFRMGTKIVTMTIASSDTASIPKDESCDDSDGDGVKDEDDAFPFDDSESVDTDGDGIGNNADIDDDNDGITDSVELANGLNPLNKADADADFDSDGFSNALELSVGSAISNVNDHPIWVPITLGDMMTIIPFYDK